MGRVEPRAELPSLRTEPSKLKFLQWSLTGSHLPVQEYGTMVVHIEEDTGNLPPHISFSENWLKLPVAVAGSPLANASKIRYVLSAV